MSTDRKTQYNFSHSMLTEGLPYKRTWTKKEDETILRLVREQGASNWAQIAKGLTCRTGKQCRERYHNHLQPHVKKGEWTEEEDRLILELQAKYGNQWAKITRELPGRTDNAVKNRWHAAMRTKKRTTSKGSHPRVPPLEFAFLSSQSDEVWYEEPPSSTCPGDIMRRIPDTIEGIVRKYSPRYTADMKRWVKTDPNHVLYGHHMHGHLPFSARDSARSAGDSTSAASTTREQDAARTSAALSVLRIPSSSNYNFCGDHSTAGVTSQAPEQSRRERESHSLRANFSLPRVPSTVNDDYLRMWAHLDDVDSESFSSCADQTGQTDTSSNCWSASTTTAADSEIVSLDEDFDSIGHFNFESSGGMESRSDGYPDVRQQRANTSQPSCRRRRKRSDCHKYDRRESSETTAALSRPGCGTGATDAAQPGGDCKRARRHCCRGHSKGEVRSELKGMCLSFESLELDLGINFEELSGPQGLY